MLPASSASSISSRPALPTINQHLAFALVMAPRHVSMSASIFIWLNTESAQDAQRFRSEGFSMRLATVSTSDAIVKGTFAREKEGSLEGAVLEADVLPRRDRARCGWGMWKIPLRNWPIDKAIKSPMVIVASDIHLVMSGCFLAIAANSESCGQSGSSNENSSGASSGSARGPGFGGGETEGDDGEVDGALVGRGGAERAQGWWALVCLMDVLGTMWAAAAPYAPQRSGHGSNIITSSHPEGQALDNGRSQVIVVVWVVVVVGAGRRRSLRTLGARSVLRPGSTLRVRRVQAAGRTWPRPNLTLDLGLYSYVPVPVPVPVGYEQRATASTAFSKIFFLDIVFPRFPVFPGRIDCLLRLIFYECSQPKILIPF
jgi:hypothetical protein